MIVCSVYIYNNKPDPINVGAYINYACEKKKSRLYVPY